VCSQMGIFVKISIMQQLICKKTISCRAGSENGNFVKIPMRGIYGIGGGREGKNFFFSKSLFDFQINFSFLVLFFILKKFFCF